MLDPLGVVTKTRQVSLEGSAGPADAPTTIVESEETTKQWQENYFYVPDIGTVPEIAVPDLLPNLIGESTPRIDSTCSGSLGMAVSCRAREHVCPSRMSPPVALCVDPARLTVVLSR